MKLSYKYHESNNTIYSLMYRLDNYIARRKEKTDSRTFAFQEENRSTPPCCPFYNFLKERKKLIIVLYQRLESSRVGIYIWTQNTKNKKNEKK